MINIISSILLLTTCLPILKSEYIPPGPLYQCPKDTVLLYPCTCKKGTDDGLFVHCENAGLAVLSVGLGNLVAMGMPVEELVLKECHISHLFGSLFHRLQVRKMVIEDTPLTGIDQYAFAGVNRTLQELRVINSRLSEFPKDAFKILGNLTTLVLDGHQISSLRDDLFVGSNMAGRIERLHITNGLIGKLPPKMFLNLGNLKVLDLHRNKIISLERNQFKGLKKTDVLDLSHNNLTSIMGIHLFDLSNLGWCNISHNSISDLPRGMFARNLLLKVLHLNNNNIKKIDSNSFKGLRYLRRLYLQDNIISDVGRGTFASVTLIATVDLARNKIKKVDYQMFYRAKYAEIINLSENEITLIEKQAFTDIYQAVVNVSHNNLTEIEVGAFENCHNLTLLDFSHNNLTVIKKGVFDENSYPMVFQVSYNNFKDVLHIPIQSMPGLQVFNISYNKLESISKSSLLKSNELHTLDFSYNNISAVYNGVFQTLLSLRYLNLSHNALERIKPGTFGTIYTLLELDLSYNNLQEVSRGGLANIASCRSLDVSHNSLMKIFQIPISLGELNLANNELTEIASNTWPTMNALLRLNLSHNQLADQLTGDSFKGLLTLQRLDLSSNAINKPPWEALNSMTSLQYLFMQDNNLTVLGRASFGHLPTIFELDLSSNRIAEVEPQAFKGMQQLIYLSLRDNELRRITNEAFKGLVALRSLDLSYNYLERIDNKTHGLLDDCLSIDKINLSHNQISVFTKKMFPSNPYIPYKLTEIDLSYNSIPVLTFDLTYGTKHLKKLNVGHNGVREIRNHVLGNLTNLQVLNLSNNKISSLVAINTNEKIAFPPNVTEIDLSNNKLTVLPVKKITELKFLRTLNVGNNSLSAFGVDLVRKMKSSDLEINFEGNQLHCDCFIRPLIHYLNHQKQSLINKNKLNLVCDQPEKLNSLKILDIEEERLICADNTANTSLESSNTGDEFVYDYELEPDLAFRDIQFAQSSIYVHWFIFTNADVADTLVYVKNATNYEFYSNTIGYNLRSVTIDLNDEIKFAIQNDRLEICIHALSSNGVPRKWFRTQCNTVPDNFKSWPRILNVDRRRLNRKNKRYRNSALSLVNDSILLTLCIFLGAFLRKYSV